MPALLDIFQIIQSEPQLASGALEAVIEMFADRNLRVREMAVDAVNTIIGKIPAAEKLEFLRQLQKRFREQENINQRISLFYAMLWVIAAGVLDNNDNLVAFAWMWHIQNWIDEMREDGYHLTLNRAEYWLGLSISQLDNKIRYKQRVQRFGKPWKYLSAGGALGLGGEWAAFEK